MMLKRSTTESKPKLSARLVRAGLAGLATVGALAGLATNGCLDRPVVEASPSTSNVYVSQIVQTSVDKIDLLFMVDNSVSMADKQEILKEAVPVLVRRLITPICVRSDGSTAGNSMQDGSCPANSAAEFNPIGDIHIGIVSSSLGSHGGNVCNPSANPDDKAHLIASVRPDAFPLAQSWNNSGFLTWDQGGTHSTPAGTTDPGALVTTFQNMIGAVGEGGCGYEASLESWYRFLIDPEPPANVIRDDVAGSPTRGQTIRGSALVLKDGKPEIDPATNYPKCNGCDEVLLAQRRAFLRPDSLVAIIMLSDENDCSIRDDGVGWFVGTTSQRMPKSTAACEANANDPCCRSCASGEASPPSGCQPLSADPICKDNPPGSYVPWDTVQDTLALRCYKQRQRFGFDLLYETQRYVNGLKQTAIPLQSSGVIVTNPLYDATNSDKAPRDPSLVFLAGIIGVPWQDISTEASLASPTSLTYLNAQQLLAEDRWTAILGSPNASPPVKPTDPFMIETTGNPMEAYGNGPRTGNNPFTNDPIVPSTANSPTASPINGHEQNVPDLTDLQYACTFKLATPRTCMPGAQNCDCSADRMGNSAAVTAANSPLCQGGANINTQTYAKGYPGVRHLQVLKDFGDNAIVASICPKVTATQDPSSDPDYGYNPAVGAIIERLKEALSGKCLARPLDLDAEGQVKCKVIEAQQANCDCSIPGRAESGPEIQGAVRAQLKATGNCDVPGRPACSTWCNCEIKQASGPDSNICRTNGTPSIPGYCYVDKSNDPGGLTDKCPSNTPQLLRFAESGGVKTPAQGSVSFIACLGAPVGVSSGAGGSGM